MDELLETLDWLQDIDCKSRLGLFESSYTFLQGPLDRKSLNTIAETYEKTSENIERNLEAIGFLITSLSTSRPLPEIPWIAELETFLKEKQADIKLGYSLNSLHNPLLSNFKDFDWRMEVQLSSRAVEDVIVPRIILQFQTDDQEKVVECDYANLKNLYIQLKNALKSFESVRAKKAEKFLKPNKNL
jgi:hypothetical protein